MKKTNKSTKLYVDGFVIAMPKKNLEIYKKIATKAGKIWKKYGAIDYKECVGEDLHPETGNMKISTFPKIAKAGKDEVVIFSYITYKSRKHRDEVNAKVMNDPFMQENDVMPFEMKKMTYGGFETIVSM
jgi:uncharacterized protein YbaA (DUF1428 family)